MKLMEKDYNSKVKIYYCHKLDPKFIDEVIGYLNLDDRLFKQRVNLIKTSKEQHKVFRFEFNNQAYYFKKYSYQNISKKIKNMFRSLEAVRAFKISNKLLEKNIPIVEPVIALTVNKGMMNYDSVLVTRDFGGITLRGFLTNYNDRYNLKQEILKKVGRLIAEFYNQNFYHGDPNMSGILLKFNQGDFKYSLVDADNIKHLFFLSWKLILKNLAKFYALTYTNLIGLGSQVLSFEDRIVIFREFIKYYKKEEEFEESIKFVIKEVVKRLLYWNKRELITNDKILNKYLKKYEVNN